MKLRTDLNTSKLSLTLSRKRYDFLGGGELVLNTVYNGYEFIGVSPDKSYLYTKKGQYFTEAGNFSKKKSSISVSPLMTKQKRAEIELVKINDIKYDPSMFIPMKTGDAIDYMFSTEGGVFPSTNYIIIGDPGIGKSTQTLDMLAKIVKEDPTKKVLFVSGEMNQIDMYGYVQRYPEFGNIPTLFLSDYVDDDPIEVLESVYNQGFDIILIDSFVEVQESIQSCCNMSSKTAEKWMVDVMIAQNKGGNKLGKFTSFLAIQQITKGGNFVGSNKLKHNTTGMIELRYSNEFSGDRYAKVLKNRRGFKHEKIYFSIEQSAIVYDQTRINRDMLIKERMQSEKESLLNEEENFNKIFGLRETQLNN